MLFCLGYFGSSIDVPVVNAIVRPGFRIECFCIAKTRKMFGSHAELFTISTGASLTKSPPYSSIVNGSWTFYCFARRHCVPFLVANLLLDKRGGRRWATAICWSRWEWGRRWSTNSKANIHSQMKCGKLLGRPTSRRDSKQHNDEDFPQDFVTPQWKIRVRLTVVDCDKNQTRNKSETKGRTATIKIKHIFEFANEHLFIIAFKHFISLALVAGFFFD